MERVALVASARTPIGKFLGSFADVTAAQLGVAATRGALERARFAPEDVDELIYGCARQAGGGPNVARQVLVELGDTEGAPRLHGEPGLRLRAPGDPARRGPHPSRQGARRARGRNREHDARAVLPRPRPARLPDGERDRRGRHVPGRLPRSDLRDWSWARRPRGSPTSTPSRARSRTPTPSRASAAPPRRSRGSDSTARSCP